MYLTFFKEFFLEYFKMPFFKCPILLRCFSLSAFFFLNFLSIFFFFLNKIIHFIYLPICCNFYFINYNFVSIIFLFCNKVNKFDRMTIKTIHLNCARAIFFLLSIHIVELPCPWQFSFSTKPPPRARIFRLLLSLHLYACCHSSAPPLPAASLLCPSDTHHLSTRIHFPRSRTV